MNIEAAMAQNEAQKTIENSDLKPLLIAPITEQLPDDGILEYVTVESIYDFAKFTAGSVVLVRSEAFDMLRVVSENSKWFGVTLKQLTGVPGADYNVAFDQVVWNLERVAYAPLVSELALDMEVAKETREKNLSVHDRERAQFTRADGSVKKLTGVALVTDEAIEDDDGEAA